MENINKNKQGAYITGRLVKEAEILKTNDGREFLKTTIAINYGIKDVTFIELLTSGKAADVLFELLKGDLVTAKGRIKLNTYIGKDKEQKAKIQFSASSIELIKKPETLEESQA